MKPQLEPENRPRLVLTPEELELTPEQIRAVIIELELAKLVKEVGGKIWDFGDPL
jgi:hypothetical protein